MKKFLKQFSCIVIVFITLFFAIFTILSNGYKKPLFFLSWKTVEKIEKSYYHSDEKSEVLSDYRKTEFSSGLSKIKGRFNFKLKKKDILGWEEATVYTIYLKPFGKIEIIYAYEFDTDEGRTRQRDEMLINGLVFVNEKGEDYENF